MREQVKQYVISLYQDIPQEAYEGLQLVFCFGVVLLIAWKGFREAPRYSVVLLLVEYIFLLFCSTVIFRVACETRKYDFQPFWSYQAIQEGRAELLAENIMNIVVFIPVGLLLSIAFKQVTWWKVLLVGCNISAVIELLQFFLMRGFSEVDDVMHNSLGCILGYVMSVTFVYGKIKIQNNCT